MAETELIQLVITKRDAQSVQRLLNSGKCDVNYKNPGDLNTALHYCYEYYEMNKFDTGLEVIRLLMSYGADVNAKNIFSETPLLLFMSRKCHHSFVKILLDNNDIDVNIVDREGCKALSYYAYYKETAPQYIFETLLSKTSDINKNLNGNIILMTFIRTRNSIQNIKALLDAGADPNCVDNDGDGVLHRIHCYDEYKIDCSALVTCLIQHGANVNAKNKNGETPLSMFLKFVCHVDTLKVLLDNGANLGAKDKWGRTPLLQLVKDNCDIELVRLLIDKGAETKCTDINGENVLHYFSEDESGLYFKVFELLLENGAEINTKNHQGQCPLTKFVNHECNVKYINMLISRGAVVDVCPIDSELYTILHLYPRFNMRQDVLELLLRCNFNINLKNIHGMSPLLSFLFYGSSVHYIKMLLDAGADLKCKDNNGSGVFHYCAEGRKNACVSLSDVVKLLITYGADINATDKNGSTPLLAFIKNSCDVDIFKIVLDNCADVHLTNNDVLCLLNYLSLECSSSRLILFKLLLEYAIDINQKNIEGFTLLSKIMKERRDNYVNYVNALVSRGADVNCTDAEGNTVLHLYACYYDKVSPDVLDIIIKNTFDVNSKNKKGRTPLMESLLRLCSAQHVQRLLDAGADVKYANEDGETVLHCCAFIDEPKSRGASTIVTLLIEYGADVNAVEMSPSQYFPNASVPLTHFVYAGCDADSVKVLLDRGANIKWTNSFEENVLHVFCKNEGDYDADVCKVLLEYGAEVNAKDNKGRSPLLNLVNSGDEILGIVRVLLDFGADVNTTDNDGECVLHKCHDYMEDYCDSFLDMLTLLLAHGVDVNCRSNTGRTPLMRFVEGRYDMQCVKLLLDRGADVNVTDNNGNNVLHNFPYWDDSSDDEDYDRHSPFQSDGGFDYISVKSSVASSSDGDSAFNILKLLLEYGANPNVKNLQAVTPLMMSIEDQSKFHFKEILLNNGASFDFKNDDFDLAECYYELGKKESVNTICKYMLLNDLTYSEYHYEIVNQMPCSQQYIEDLENFTVEVRMLKTFTLKDQLTLYDFLKESCHRKLGMYFRDCSLDLDVLKATFPCYFKLIKLKLEKFTKWRNVMTKVTGLSFSSKSQSNDAVVTLNPDCVWLILSFLSDGDLLKLAHTVGLKE